MKFKYIKKKLIELYSEVKVDNEQGLFDINKMVEDVYMHILNDVYGWELQNANLLKENFPAIDLLDEDNSIVIQVTSTTDTTKLKGTIEKFKKLGDKYQFYDLKMFYIKDKPNFKDTSLEAFEKEGVGKSDLLGIKDILDKVKSDTEICDKLYKTLQNLFDDEVKKSSVTINVHGDVKGVVNAEDGSVINQTIS